jgi:hypothetical protein
MEDFTVRPSGIVSFFTVKQPPQEAANSARRLVLEKAALEAHHPPITMGMFARIDSALIYQPR